MNQTLAALFVLALAAGPAHADYPPRTEPQPAEPQPEAPPLEEVVLPEIEATREPTGVEEAAAAAERGPISLQADLELQLGLNAGDADDPVSLSPDLWLVLPGKLP